MGFTRRARPARPDTAAVEPEEQADAPAPSIAGLPEIPPSVAAAVRAWLSGRTVGSSAMRGDTLVVVSWPDCQKATWRL